MLVEIFIDPAISNFLSTACTTVLRFLGQWNVAAGLGLQESD